MCFVVELFTIVLQQWYLNLKIFGKSRYKFINRKISLIKTEMLPKIATILKNVREDCLKMIVYQHENLVFCPNSLFSWSWTLLFQAHFSNVKNWFSPRLNIHGSKALYLYFCTLWGFIIMFDFPHFEVENLSWRECQTFFRNNFALQ